MRGVFILSSSSQSDSRLEEGKLDEQSQVEVRVNLGRNPSVMNLCQNTFGFIYGLV